MAGFGAPAGPASSPVPVIVGGAAAGFGGADEALDPETPSAAADLTQAVLDGAAGFLNRVDDAVERCVCGGGGVVCAVGRETGDVHVSLHARVCTAVRVRARAAHCGFHLWTLGAPSLRHPD